MSEPQMKNIARQAAEQAMKATRQWFPAPTMAVDTRDHLADAVAVAVLKEVKRLWSVRGGIHHRDIDAMLADPLSAREQGRTLADYNPQHDEGCRSAYCVFCQHPLEECPCDAVDCESGDCTCGLDRLLSARETTPQEQEKNLSRSDQSSLRREADPRGDRSGG